MVPKKESKIWTVLGLIIFAISIYVAIKYSHDMEKLVRKSGVAAPIVVLVIYAVAAPTPISSDPLTVVNVAMFGLIFGMAISWAGNNIGAMVEYYFGAHLSKTTNFHQHKEKLPFGLGNVPVSSPWFLIGGRLIPGYGGKVISIMAGMYHVSVKRFFWTTAIVNFLGALLLGFGGYGAITLFR